MNHMTHLPILSHLDPQPINSTFLNYCFNFLFNVQIIHFSSVFVKHYFVNFIINFVFIKLHFLKINLFVNVNLLRDPNYSVFGLDFPSGN
jgi:hypothetical protein